MLSLSRIHRAEKVNKMCNMMLSIGIKEGHNYVTLPR